MDRILDSDRINSYRYVKNIFIIYLKLKILIAIVMPNLILKKIKN